MIGWKPAQWDWGFGSLEPQASLMLQGCGALWPLWEQSGKTTKALIGQDATAAGSVVWGRNERGGALRMDNGGSTPHAPVFTPTEATKDITVLCVFTQTSINYPEVLFANRGLWFLGSESGGAIRWVLENGGDQVSATSPYPLVARNTTCIVGNYNGTTIKVWDNGAKGTDTGWTTGMGSPTTDIAIGNDSSDAYVWNGLVNMAAIWPYKCLADEQCAALSRDPFMLIRPWRRAAKLKAYAASQAPQFRIHSMVG